MRDGHVLQLEAPFDAPPESRLVVEVQPLDTNRAPEGATSRHRKLSLGSVIEKGQIMVIRNHGGEMVGIFGLVAFDLVAGAVGHHLGMRPVPSDGLGSGQHHVAKNPKATILTVNETQTSSLLEFLWAECLGDVAGAMRVGSLLRVGEVEGVGIGI